MRTEWPKQPVAYLLSAGPAERVKCALWPLHRQVEQAARCLLPEPRSPQGMQLDRQSSNNQEKLIIHLLDLGSRGPGK